MFAQFNSALEAVGLGLAGVGAGAAILAVVVLALMNLWGILDPRMGSAVKGGLLKVILTGVLLGTAGGTTAIMAQLGVH
jgi:hypothetical protein